MGGAVLGGASKRGELAWYVAVAVLGVEYDDCDCDWDWEAAMECGVWMGYERTIVRSGGAHCGHGV